MATESERRLLRHFLATIAYRSQKAVRGAPAHFSEFRAARGVRTPHELVRHMSDVLGYARAHLRGDSWRARRLPTFDEEVERLHEILDDLSAQLATADLADGLPDRLLQGPLSDAMSHAGQLAMLREDWLGLPFRPRTSSWLGLTPTTSARTSRTPRVRTRNGSTLRMNPTS